MKTAKIKLLVALTFFLTISNFSPAQFGFSMGGGAADIVFLQLGQTPYLGYENHSLIHNVPLLSFDVGINQRFELSNRYSCKVGLHYSLQGLNYSTSYLYDDFGFHLYLSYIKIPVLLQINTQLNNNKNSGILLGPYFATILDATQLTKVQGVKTKKQMNNINPVDFGATIAYSWDIGKVPGRLFFEFSCSYSVINMMSYLDGAPEYGIPDKKYARNASLIFAMEYQLRKK